MSDTNIRQGLVQLVLDVDPSTPRSRAEVAVDSCLRRVRMGAVGGFTGGASLQALWVLFLNPAAAPALMRRALLGATLGLGHQLTRAPHSSQVCDAVFHWNSQAY